MRTLDEQTENVERYKSAEILLSFKNTARWSILANIGFDTTENEPVYSLAQLAGSYVSSACPKMRTSAARASAGLPSAQAGQVPGCGKLTHQKIAKEYIFGHVK